MLRNKQNITNFNELYKLFLEVFAVDFIKITHSGMRVGLMVNALVWIQVWIQALARDNVLCFWERHFTLTVPLSTQVYKWVLVNLMLRVTLRWSSIPYPIRGGGGEQKYQLHAAKNGRSSGLMETGYVDNNNSSQY